MVYLPMFSPKKKAGGILERILQLFSIDDSLKGVFRDHVGFGLSIMVKKYFGPTSKTEELLIMLERNVENTRLRMVAEFEADFERQLFERKLSEKDAEIEAISSQKEAEIEAISSQKDAEIDALKAKLEANGIAY